MRFKIKNYDLNNITVGGYYPVNYEVDDLDLLKDLSKKQITISLPAIIVEFAPIDAPFLTIVFKY